MKKFDVPKDVKYILARIHEANEEAYIVGGCVRDLLLGIEPSDWDVTTSATPERVKKLFDRTIDTGLSHGTVTVMINKENYEVTTYRIDGKYEDYRRPKDVLFTRWTMYLHDLGKSETKTTDEKGIDHFYKHPINSERLARVILKRLKFDNRTIDKVSILVKYHDDRFLVTKKSVRKAINRIGIDNFEDFLLVKESDIKGQSFEFMDKHLLELKQIKELYQSIIKDGECLEIKDLTINGNDIIKLGVKNGKEVGVILNRLLEMVLEEPSLNTKENLSKLTIKLMIGE